MDDPGDTVFFPVTERSRLRRQHRLGGHARSDVHAILDAAPFAHIGYLVEGAPYVTPTLHWRVDDRIYWHGSSASRFLRRADAWPVCITCTLFDGYVLARSAFEHSANYRSVMAFGTARRLEDSGEKIEALRTKMAGLFPGRWDGLRPVTEAELKATTILRTDIEEATVKIRTGPPTDGDEEGQGSVWAGELPLLHRWALPVAAPELRAPATAPAPPARLFCRLP